MKLLLAALTIWSLPFLGISCGSANFQSPEPSKTQSTPSPLNETVTLTNEHPTGSFLLQRETTKLPPTVLEASVTKVVNPKAKPVSIFVSVVPITPAGDIPPVRIEVGNFSLYPADRPGKFLLDARPALQKISETERRTGAKKWQVVFALEQKPEQESSPVEVTISAPNWKTEKN
jgi:hypothetical protein